MLWEGLPVPINGHMLHVNSQSLVPEYCVNTGWPYIPLALASQAVRGTDIVCMHAWRVVCLINQNEMESATQSGI